ncbi:CRISPR-associated endonuclease Cas2 [Prevotella sp. PINT]|jgi:CRISPR-associated endoribonuclease Cas2|uniref:CRISPR-associated endonuclease Cas2 n=1 Tax=Palleniella intestinalis TaxID=2736291 RepID=UPI0015571D1B|nr:CRISPR-associated endonuclease Cas2 [Palleniella intestinalis]NPD82143.1 CRISPR-associated endonuclease Cas2 [Palleniella intestinalis]
MYVILVYDFGEKRTGKMLKLCRRYLNWIQNSVFEGEISEVRLKEMLMLADKFMDRDSDSIIIFKSEFQHGMEKMILGMERKKLDNFL